MIWRVTIELTMYVEADTEDEAHEVAESSAWKEAQNGVEFMHAKAVTATSEVNADWGTSLPWGGDGRSTVYEVIEAKR